MLNLKNEWMKMIRKHSTLTLLILTALFPLLVGPAVKVLQNRFSFTAFDGETFPLVILNIAVTFYLPLLLALAVSDMFAGEEEQKTAAFLLVRPITRIKLYSSKIACTGIYLLSLLLILCLMSLLTGAIWLDNFTFHGLMLGIAAYLISWLPLMAMGLLMIFLVQWFGSSSRAITFSILLYLVMIVLNFLFPTISRWLPSYDSNWYQRWMNSGMNIVIFGRSIYLLSWCAMFFTLGYYKFFKKEY